MDPYTVLGVAKTASGADIKKAYHRLAKVWHPDRVSTPAEKEANTKRFLDVSHAYEILGDPDKRKRYDQCGAVSHGSNSATVPPYHTDMFTTFFENVGYNMAFLGDLVQMPCTLEEICAGATKTVPIVKRYMDGSGRHKTQTVTIQLQKHWREGTKIRYAGMGDEYPGRPPREAIVVLVEIPNRRYQRMGDDLIIKSTVGLAEALCGFDYCIKDLTGTSWHAKSTQIITPTECTLRISGAGMHRKDGTRGDIYVEFTIQFPTTLSREQKKALVDTFKV